jgi:hypothetical protein
MIKGAATKFYGTRDILHAGLLSITRARHVDYSRK